MYTFYNYAVNCGFGWLLTAMAVVGYIVTLKRTGEIWLFWVVLATGWSLFSIAQTLLATGHTDNVALLGSLGLSSWVLMVTSLLMVFLKLTRVKDESRLLDNKESND